MVNLTINDQSLQVPAGTSVLEAAQQNDIYIPTLCHHPQLTPVGACRLCVVEVDGMRGLTPSCTTVVNEGMVVRTDSPAAQELRREVLALILSEHPYTCLVCRRHARCQEWQGTIRKAGVTTGCENCPKNGQCELQVLVDKIGLDEMPYPITYRGFEVEKQDPFFDRDYNLCILCGRCIRACQELRRNGVLAFTFRGPQARVGTAFNEPHTSLDCEFCGECVDVCPTGALFDKRTKWEGAPERTATSVCPYCSVGCELELQIKKNRIIGVRPAAHGFANRGQLCVRGRFGLVELVHAPDRLRFPMVRKAVQGNPALGMHGADKPVASANAGKGDEGRRLVPVKWDEALGLASEKLAAYKGDAFALLTSPNLTSESLYVLQAFARQVMQTKNVDCTTVQSRFADGRSGNSPAELLKTTPRSEIQKIREARVILVIGANPRESHPVVDLQIRHALAQGARLVVMDPRETDLAQRADIWLRPEPGTDHAWVSELVEEVKLASSEGVREIRTKAEARRSTKIQAAVQLLRSKMPVVIIYGSGVTHYPTAPATIRAIQKLAEAIGPAGLVTLAGAANALGALNVGAVAGDGERNYDEIVARIASGEIKALYLVGEVPPLDILKRLEFLIVQDILPTSNLEDYADVVLPATTFGEMSGSMVNLEGRVQTFQAALTPPGEARPDWWICAQLARRMGEPGFDWASTDEILKRIETSNSSTEFASGDNDGADGFAVTSHKYPFTLVVERDVYSYRGGLLTERVKGMDQIKRQDQVTIHPQDAKRLGLKEGDLIRLASAYGKDTALVRVSSEVLPKMAFAACSSLVGSDLFPARLPHLKACAIRIERAEGKE